MITSAELPPQAAGGHVAGGLARFFEEMRVIIVAGVSAGVLLIGVGSRIAMLLLRLTSPDRVDGVISDDGFEIGQVTLSGSYNLLLLGAAFGMIGALAYRMVAPWLIGPQWFRRLTTALASGAVVGAMLVHADGIDFTLLKPMWFAIGLFILLPAIFGWFIGVFVDSVRRPSSWTARGHLRWILPIVSLALFPPAAFVLIPIVVVIALYAALQETDLPRMLHANTVGTLVVRSAWLGIALFGLVILVQDIQDIAAVTA